MSRRTTQLFSLSLLDLLTSALGAVIFLFIITPKGGQSPAKTQQAVVYFDTTQMKIYGDLPDSLLSKSAGDTLMTMLLAYKDLPKPAPAIPEHKYAYDEPRPKPQPAPEPKEPTPPKPVPVSQPDPKPEPPKPPVTTPPASLPPEKTEPSKQPPTYKGDAPSVPCKVSFEIKWASREDNIDLYVCKGNNCVYGGRKKDSQIGEWDSGKSRNRVFGNDLRTNQEAVRQFDNIIPGEYKIYAEFKESGRNNKSTALKGLVYTQDAKNQERGENFSRTIEQGKGRTLIATIVLNKDGTYLLK